MGAAADFAISNQQFAIFNSMRLYVEPMDAVLVEVTDDGRVRFEDQELARPTLQERRAILYAAEEEMQSLAELVEILSKTDR